MRRRLVRRVVALGTALALASGSTSLAGLPSPGPWLNGDKANLDEVGNAQGLLQRLVPEVLGGIWIDSNGTTVIAAVRGDKRVADAVEGQLTIGPVKFISVDWSEDELEEVAATVAESAGPNLVLDGVQVAAIEPDVMQNRVNLVLVDQSAAALARISGRMHPAANVSTVNASTTGDACHNSGNCPDPLKAGLKGYRSSSFACMTGFQFVKNSTYYWATAGHCNSASGTIGWRTPTETWQHPAGTDRGGVAYMGWYSNSPADMALIQISSLQRSNQLCIGTTCANIRSITSREVADSSGEVIGQSLCVQRQTGQNCGTLVSRNLTISICQPGSGICRTITKLRRSTMLTYPGDSGAPVYYSSEAIGGISGDYPATDDATYSHVYYLEQSSGALVKTTNT